MYDSPLYRQLAVDRELKHQTSVSHERQPEVWITSSCILRMSLRLRGQVADARTRVLKFKGERENVEPHERKMWVICYFSWLLALGKSILRKKKIQKAFNLGFTAKTFVSQKHRLLNLPISRQKRRPRSSPTRPPCRSCCQERLVLKLSNEYERLRTYPRFEKEAIGNSEMAYWLID